jgi:hypothetical protein
MREQVLSSRWQRVDGLSSNERRVGIALQPKRPFRSEEQSVGFSHQRWRAPLERAHCRAAVAAAPYAQRTRERAKGSPNKLRNNDCFCSSRCAIKQRSALSTPRPMNHEPNFFESIPAELSDVRVWVDRAIVLGYAVLAGVCVVEFTMAADWAFVQFRCRWNTPCRVRRPAHRRHRSSRPHRRRVRELATASRSWRAVARSCVDCDGHHGSVRAAPVPMAHCKDVAASSTDHIASNAVSP